MISIIKHLTGQSYRSDIYNAREGDSSQPFAPPDYNDIFAQFLQGSGAGEDLGFRTYTAYAGGVNLRKELKRQGASKQLINDIIAQGIDLDKNYGAASGEYDAIRNRVTYLIQNDPHGPSKVARDRIKAGGKVGAVQEGKYKESLDNLVMDVSNFGESKGTTKFERLTGLAGLTSVERYDAIREFQKNNPGTSIKDLTKSQLSALTGFNYEDKAGSKFFEADKTELDKQSQSEKFQQYSTAKDIFQTGLESQKAAQENFLAAQKKVREPGYVQGAIDQAFAPQQTQLNQYFDPAGGAQYSQAAQDVGAGEAALGRTGSDRVAVALAREKGMAQERLMSQKSQAAGQLQQYIDLQNPTEALRYGSAIGQQALGNIDFFKNRLLAPYAQVFPMAAQNYQLGLTPYTMSRAAQEQPSALDYGMQGGLGLGQIIASFYGAGSS